MNKNKEIADQTNNQKQVNVDNRDEMSSKNKSYNESKVEHRAPSNAYNEIRETNGILIYESARRKLNISDNGRIYRQKFFNYIPFFSVITVLVYVNYIFGKTKCLKDSDHALFKKAHFWSNMIGFLIMPIVALALWTFGTWMLFDVFQDSNTNYANMWQHYYDSIQGQDIGVAIGNAIGGLFEIAIAPLSPSPLLILNISGTPIHSNIIFILVLAVFTIINPVNIIFTYLMNSKMLRFVTVKETSSIYRYRR